MKRKKNNGPAFLLACCWRRYRGHPIHADRLRDGRRPLELAWDSSSVTNIHLSRSRDGRRHRLHYPCPLSSTFYNELVLRLELFGCWVVSEQMAWSFYYRRTNWRDGRDKSQLIHQTLCACGVCESHSTRKFCPHVNQTRLQSRLQLEEIELEIPEAAAAAIQATAAAPPFEETWDGPSGSLSGNEMGGYGSSSLSLSLLKVTAHRKHQS